MENQEPAFRIGTGYDVHRLTPGRKLVLGGVEIPHTHGLEGHSDADALLHAVCDAILGALAAGDIGTHFPNTDPRWKDCRSSIFVSECVRLAHERGYAISNADATILAEKPRIMPHAEAMRAAMAEMLCVPRNCIGLKAGTNEQIGFVGREEGIAAMAVVLLRRET